MDKRRVTRQREDSGNYRESRERCGRDRVVKRHGDVRKTGQQIRKIKYSCTTRAEGQTCVWAERGSDKQG